MQNSKYEDIIPLHNNTYVISYLPDNREELCFILKNSLGIIVRMAQERSKWKQSIWYNEQSTKNLQKIYEIYIKNVGVPESFVPPKAYLDKVFGNKYPRLKEICSKPPDPHPYLSIENMSCYTHLIDYSKLSDEQLQTLKDVCWEERFETSNRDNKFRFVWKIPEQFHIDISADYTYRGKPVFCLKKNEVTERLSFSVAKNKSTSVTHHAFLNGIVAYGIHDFFRSGDHLVRVGR